MQLYLFKTFLGIFYVDIYQQMSTEKTPKNAKKTPQNTIVKYVTLSVTN